MNKAKVFTAVGLIFGLALAGIGYLGLTGQPELFFAATVTTVEDQLREDSGPVFLQLPGKDFLDDKAARKLLWQSHELGLPSVARVTKIDQEGVWSSVFLGPFSSKAELEQGKRNFEEKFGLLLQGNLGLDSANESTNSYILLEIAATVADEDVFELLEGPDQAQVYAFVRTAEVVGGPTGVQALNRIYLGPFVTENEALAAMGNLHGWGPASGFVIRHFPPLGL